MPWPNAKQFDSLFAKIAIAAYFIPVLLAAGLGWLTGPRNFWSWLLTLGPIFYFCRLHADFFGIAPLSIAGRVSAVYRRRRSVCSKFGNFLCRGRPKEAGPFPASPAGV